MTLGNKKKKESFDDVGFQQRLDTANNVHFGSMRNYARECAKYHTAKAHPNKINTYLNQNNPSLPTLDYYYALCKAAKLPFEYLALGRTEESCKKVRMLENHINKLEIYTKKLELKLTKLKTNHR